MYDVVTSGGVASAAIAPIAPSQSLRRTLQSWDDLFERLPIGVYACDRDGTVVQYNRRAVELWGCAPDLADIDVRFCGAHKLYWPNGRPLPHRETPMGEVLRTGKPVRDEKLVIEQPNGSRVTVLVNVEPLFDDDGAIAGAVNCLQDVTGLERADQALREQDQRLAATYEHADIGIAEADAQGRHLRVNEPLCTITGYSRDEMLTRTFFDNTLPDDIEPDRSLYRRQIAGEFERYTVEKRYVRRNGSVIWVSVKSSLVRDDAGRFLYGVRVIQDITKRKQAEERLRERERQFRELLEALPAAVYTTDAAGRITFYNQSAARLAGREPELGSDEWCVTWRLFRADGTPLPHDQCPMAVTLKENRPVRGVEAVAERPDGTRVPFIPYPTPLRDEAGELVGAVNMLVDISERKQSEANQRMLVDELNHRVKNNMQMLHALLRAAQRETKSPEARAVLADASQRVGAMAAAQQVLYDAGSPISYKAKDFLDAVCASAKQAFTKNIEVVVSESTSEGLSNDTAMPLALILNELLTNAAKHGINGRGEGRIKVGLTNSSDSFALYVEDDGPGFELEEARRRSSGLGLVTGLARQLGGSFEVERTPAARCIVRFVEQRIAQ
jgi:PAS domain S-box-containing protein